MKEYLQENYKKIISYVFVAIAVISVLATGISAIIKVQNTEMKTYCVHGQYESVYPPGGINEPESYIYEFVCVGENTQALLVRGQIWELSSGTIWYRIEDEQGNPIIENTEDIQDVRHPNYDGAWIDVSELGLVQGEHYKFMTSLAWTDNVLIGFEDFKISVSQIFEYNYAPFYTAFVILFMASTLIWVYLVHKKGYGAKVYFVTSLILGVVIMLLMPPVNRDDEYRHFLRAYMEVKELQPVLEAPVGGESGLIGDDPNGEYMLDVPYEINELRLMGYEDNYNGYEYKTETNQFLCIDKLIATLKEEPAEETSRVSVAAVIYKDTSSYWPQIISMEVAEFLGARDLFLYYAARFGQLFVCILMEVLAMKLAPRMKEIIWLLSFIPNAFLLKASCNPDGLMTAEILLLAAIIVWMKEEKIDILSKKGIVGCLLYLSLSYNIMLMKFPYILISLGFFVYWEKENVEKIWKWIQSCKKQALYIAGVIAAVGVAVLCLMKERLLSLVYIFLPQTHIAYIIEHPGEIFRLFIEKWGFMCVNLLSGMNGEFFIPYAIFVFAILIMMKKQLSTPKRIWFGVLFGILIMVIVLAGYSLSPADYGKIEEIGYRYLLPFLVVGAIALPSGNEKTETYAKQLMPLAIFVTMTTTMITWIVGWSV